MRSIDTLQPPSGLVLLHEGAHEKLDYIRELGGFGLLAFDNDGTLTQEGGSWEAMCKALPVEGGEGVSIQQDHKDLRRKFGDYEHIPRMHQAWTKAASGLHINQTTRQAIEQAGRTTMKPRLGTADLFKSSNEEGIDSIVVTAGPETPIQAFLQEYKIPIQTVEGVKLEFDHGDIVTGLKQTPPLVPTYKHKALDPIIRRRRKLQGDFGILAVGDGMEDSTMTKDYRDSTFIVRLDGRKPNQSDPDYSDLTREAGFDAYISKEALAVGEEMLVLQALKYMVKEQPVLSLIKSA